MSAHVFDAGRPSAGIAARQVRVRTPAIGLRPMARLRLALSVARERAALAEASPELLRDIGVDPADAAREAARPFWELPERR